MRSTTTDFWISQYSSTHIFILRSIIFYFLPGIFYFLMVVKHSTLFCKKLKKVICEYNRLNGWNSTLQAAWFIRHVPWAWLFYISFIVWSLWTKPTIWWLILSFTNFYGKSFARVLYLILMKVMGRWLRWILPGQEDDFPQPFCALIMRQGRGSEATEAVFCL